MDFTTAITELEALGTEQTKKTYKNHGALEPLFGVTLRDMKPLTKKIKKDHALAMELYATGNYDAQTLAGIIAEPSKMTGADFELWMETANCHTAADYVVAVTLQKQKLPRSLPTAGLTTQTTNIDPPGGIAIAGFSAFAPMISLTRISSMICFSVWFGKSMGSQTG